MKNKQKMVVKSKNRGITLIGLIVTIIVLLILAGITIGALTGENGLIEQALSGKDKAEISNEKEILEVAAIQSIKRDKFGEITKVRLQTALDENTTKGATNVEEEVEEAVLLTTFVQSNRVYEVDKEGNIKYLGKEEELLKQAIIEASPESDTTPRLVQNVEITVRTPLSIPDENITLVYAWSNSENEKPEENEYTKATLTGTNRIRKSVVSSNDSKKGDYYLWAKVIISGNEIEQCFGPYAIKDHTTLVTCNTEKMATSSFLGNTTIVRNQIESVTIETSLETHTTADENCWDVSADSSEKYLAWYEDTDSDGYYEVTIAGEGGVVANSNSSYLFSYVGYNGDDTTVFKGLENLDTGLVTIMNYMFYNCKNATNIDVSGFVTNNVIIMKSIFYGCSSLTNLEVSNWNTSNVTDMEYVFNGCNNLTNVDVSNWDTSNVIRMKYMFGDCANLTSIDVSRFDTSNVTDMSAMFLGCTNLKKLDVSKFNTSKVKGMGSMFKGCNNLASIDVSKFDTSNATSMRAMFSYCTSLTNIDVSKFNTSNVTSTEQMFHFCSNLTSINVSNFDTSNVTNMYAMFHYCTGLTNIDVSKFNTSNVTIMKQMFSECNKLTSLEVNGFKTENVANMERMFENCNNLTSLDLSNLKTSNVTDMDKMFYGCESLLNLNLSGFDTSNVTAYGNMFYKLPTTITITTNKETETWIKENFTAMQGEDIEWIIVTKEETNTEETENET